MSNASTKLLSPAQLTAVAQLFNALPEPSRLLLLQALQKGPLTVSELIEASGLKQANVSKHLTILHQHRLVERVRQGTCIQYSISDPIVFALCELVCGKMQRDAKEAAAIFQLRK